MQTWIGRIVAPPVFEGEEDKTRVAQLLNRLLLTCLAVAVVTSILAPMVFAQPDVALMVTGLIVVLTLVCLILMRRGYVRLASMLMILGLWISFTLLMLYSDGVSSVFAMGYITCSIIAGLLLGGRAALVVVETSIVAGLGMLMAKLAGLLPPPLLSVEAGAAWLNLTANLVVAAALLYLAGSGIRESLEQARRSTAELKEQRERLEETVTERTRDLERRASQLATAADVGRVAASLLELEPLTGQVVELVHERFVLYYVGLFLLDDTGQYAVLEAGTGEEGRTMRARGHKLAVGSASVVGAACAERQARIAFDVAAVIGEVRVEPSRFDNPLLPHTRSEVALPLMVRDRVLGALDVQSVRQAAFSQEDIAVLQLVADQVAVAVDNARRFSAEAELLETTSPLFRVSRRLVSAGTADEIIEIILAATAETEADGCVIARLNYAPDDTSGPLSAGPLSAEAVTVLGQWNRYRSTPARTLQSAGGAARTSSDGASAVIFAPAGSSQLLLQSISSLWTSEDITQNVQVVEGLRSFLVGLGGRSFVNVPMRAGERVIGFVSVYRITAGPFSPVSIRFYETMVDQAAVAMERARLIEEAQSRAARERLIAEVTARMHESLDVHRVLQTAADEIYQTLGLEKVVIRLAEGAEESPT